MPMTRSHPQVLFKNRKPDRIATLDEYRAGGGYEALARVLAEDDRQAVRKVLIDAVLLGRGGAAFPAGKKVTPWPRTRPIPGTWSATPTRWSRAPSRTGC